MKKKYRVTFEIESELAITKLREKLRITLVDGTAYFGSVDPKRIHTVRVNTPRRKTRPELENLGGYA